MILFVSKKYKGLEISFIDINRYNDEIKRIKSYSLKCSCGCKGSLIKYGKYKRIIDDYVIYIQRVYCKNCGITHALMPSFVIPYERQSVGYVFEMLSSGSDNKADYELNRYKRIYDIWKERLDEIGFNVSDDLNRVITFCACYYKMGFLQNRIRVNKKKKIVKYYVINLPT
ncbi:MAG: hypothetical protein IKP77_00235 [Acholeplasmatales bacterium]|nr:hypothetical protein [Acholeplasmatales bacterium]